MWAPVLPYGCERICRHGSTGECLCPEVKGRGQPVPFDRARASGGACGPEAEHMDFPGLRAPQPRYPHATQ